MKVRSAFLLGAMCFATIVTAQTPPVSPSKPAQEAPPAPVAKPTPVLTPAEARMAEGRKLAALFLPREVILGIGTRNTERGLRIGLGANPEHQALEKQYPGLTDAIAAAMRPRVEVLMDQGYPPYVEKVASFYASRFTISEIASAVRFYGQPFMRRVTRESLGAIQVGGVVQDMKAQVANGIKDPKISEAAIRREASAATRQTVNRMSRTEMQAAYNFSQGSFAIKMARLEPEMSKLSAGNANEQAAQFASDEELRTLAAAAMADFIAKSEVARASSPPTAPAK